MSKKNCRIRQILVKNVEFDNFFSAIFFSTNFFSTNFIDKFAFDIFVFDKIDVSHLFYSLNLDILQKILMNTPNHAEREYLISSNIIESITYLLNNNRDFPLLHETLRLLLHMIDKT